MCDCDFLNTLIFAFNRIFYSFGFFLNSDNKLVVDDITPASSWGYCDKMCHKSPTQLQTSELQEVGYFEAKTT